ncbi:MAG TPA: ATP-binding protein [Acidimicrobiales bacterium]|nr:ATP-binding protein [Acidimicrobiales bacterium]
MAGSTIDVLGPGRFGPPIPGDGGQIEAKRLFYGDASSVGEARRFVRDALAATDAPPDVVDAGVLLVSELATNATLHARTDFQVTVRFETGILEGEVRDWSPQVPLVGQMPESATTGRGLTLVEAVATRWGSDGDHQGKVVWFAVEAQPPVVQH